jgi:Flp pilus assembly pilin Flp
MFETVRRFIRDDRGASAVDYAVVMAVFAMAVLATMNVVGSEAAHQLSSTQSQLTNSASLVGPGSGSGSGTGARVGAGG